MNRILAEATGAFCLVFFGCGAVGRMKWRAALANPTCKLIPGDECCPT